MRKFVLAYATKAFLASLAVSVMSFALAQPVAPPGVPMPQPAGPVPQASAAQAPNSQAPQILSMPELQALVSPVALYPDELLAQMLMASTYPLQVAQAALWLRANPGVTGAKLESAMAKQTWDNSVKSLVPFPDALNMLGNKLSWTQSLGDAYLAQPQDLMQAVQALRTMARQAGNLNATPQMAVTTDPQSNIIITPANPQVVYVPAYSPAVVYGPWPYPAYPPYPVYNPAWGYVAFGTGFAVGSALWAYPRWGNGTIVINNYRYNTFNRGYNAAHFYGTNYAGPQRAWQHPVQRTQIQPQQGNWYKTATPQQKQQAQQARQHAQTNFNQHATPQQKQQVQQLKQNNHQRQPGRDGQSGGGGNGGGHGHSR